MTAIELVTASGDIVRTDWANEPDLFCASRRRRRLRHRDCDRVQPLPAGAGLRRHPLVPGRPGGRDPEGVARLDGRAAGRDDVRRPDPPVPAHPADPGGRARQSFVVVEAIYAGDAADGERLLAPLRALGPVLDTVAPTPVRELSKLHMDPEGPAPGAGDGGLLDDVDDHLIDLFVEHVVGAPILSAELRQLGGAVARRSSQHGAIDAWEAPFSLFAIGVAPTPEAKHAVEDAVARLRSTLEPWESDHTYLNFAESRRSATTLFSDASYYRLRRIKAIVDPADLIRSNHPIAPAFLTAALPTHSRCPGRRGAAIAFAHGPGRRRNPGARLPRREAADDARPVSALAERAPPRLQPGDEPRPGRRLRRSEHPDRARPPLPPRLGAPRERSRQPRRSTGTCSTRRSAVSPRSSRSSRC